MKIHSAPMRARGRTGLDAGSTFSSNPSTSQEEILAFVRSTILSVWDMELLLLLHDDPEREWTAEQLVHQLRASDTVVSSGLGRLHTAGIIIQGARDAYRYRSEAPRLDFVVQALANTYRSNPVSVIKMIVGAPDADLRIFSDAFRIRD